MRSALNLLHLLTVTTINVIASDCSIHIFNYFYQLTDLISVVTAQLRLKLKLSIQILFQLNALKAWLGAPLLLFTMPKEM